MKRQVVAAAFAVFVSHSAAQAIEVKSYDADAAFARKIANWFEQAPAAFKDRMFDSRLIVVKDKDVLAKVQTMVRAPENDIKKLNDPFIIAVSYKGVPGTQPRAIIFIQSGMLKNIEEWQRHTVMHEMMHLFDGHPELFWRSKQQYFSNANEFTELLNADKADYERKPASKSKKWFDYYFSSPQEAYAEAGARAILPLVGARYKESNYEFNNLFSRVNR